MASAMEGNILRNTALFYHLFQWLAYRPIVQIRENGLVCLKLLVTLDNLQGDVKQFHLERDFGLVSFG